MMGLDPPGQGLLSLIHVLGAQLAAWDANWVLCEGKRPDVLKGCRRLPASRQSVPSCRME